MEHRDWLMIACGPEAVRRHDENVAQQRAALAAFLAGHTRIRFQDGVTVYIRKPGYVPPPQTSKLTEWRRA